MNNKILTLTAENTNLHTRLNQTNNNFAAYANYYNRTYQQLCQSNPQDLNSLATTLASFSRSNPVHNQGFANAQVTGQPSSSSAPVEKLPSKKSKRARPRTPSSSTTSSSSNESSSPTSTSRHSRKYKHTQRSRCSSRDRRDDQEKYDRVRDYRTESKSRKRYEERNNGRGQYEAKSPMRRGTRD